MSVLAAFLREALSEGRLCPSAPPYADDPGARAVLRKAHALALLSLAGPPLAFDEAAALAAGRLLIHATWYFLNPGLPIEAFAQSLAMPSPPTKPEQHFSADLALRFLPTLLRRAEAMSKEDVLADALRRTLREWPLSGVLTDVSEPPLSPVDFGAHAGLNFLYAERLAARERPGWFPRGRGMQYVELVWEQLGKDVSVLPALQEMAQRLQATEAPGKKEKNA